MNQQAAIEGLLEQAKAAHFEYEQNELKGVYDEGWPGWYAGFVVDNGLPELLGRDVRAVEVLQFFVSSYDEFKASGGDAAESWTSYTARRMVEVLGSQG